MTNILEYLEAAVRRCPDKTAFSDGRASLSFRQLYDQSRGIGSTLLQKGLTGKPVLICMGTHPRTTAACLGVVYSGCHYTVLDHATSLPRASAILEDFQPDLILFDAAAKPLLSRLNYGGPCLSYEAAAFRIIDEASLSHIRQAQQDTDPVYVMYSVNSGSDISGCHRDLIDSIEARCPVPLLSGGPVPENRAVLSCNCCPKEIFAALKYGITTHLIP